MAAAAMMAGVPPVMNDLDPAVGSDLIRVDGSVVRFRHPLVRSAVYQAATVAERLAAHASLAEVLVGDPERRVWHRAAAAVGPDMALAAELEDTADGARRRGDLFTPAAGYERAAGLTADSRRQAELPDSVFAPKRGTAGPLHRSGFTDARSGGPGKPSIADAGRHERIGDT